MAKLFFSWPRIPFPPFFNPPFFPLALALVCFFLAFVRVSGAAFDALVYEFPWPLVSNPYLRSSPLLPLVEISIL